MWAQLENIVPTKRRIPLAIREYSSGSLQRYLIDLGAWASDVGLEGARKRGHVGLRPAHNHVLANMDFEGVRVTDIARKLKISNNAIGQLVSDLEEMGYVERVADKIDRRAKILRYTPRGIALLRDASEIGEEIKVQLNDFFGEDDFKKLMLLLNKLHTEKCR